MVGLRARQPTFVRLERAWVRAVRLRLLLRVLAGVVWAVALTGFWWLRWAPLRSVQAERTDWVQQSFLQGEQAGA